MSRHELIPIALAARILYQRVHGALLPEPHLAERLNGLAYRLARLGGVYSLGGKHSTPRRVSPSEVAKGYFRYGAKELHFLNGRAPLAAIAVTEQCIEAAARAMAADAESEEKATQP